MERLEFKDSNIEFLDAAGRPLWSVTLGKNAEAGGRFIRFDHEAKAYLADLSSPLDADPKAWANAQLLDLKPEDIAALEMSFAQGGPVIFQRAKKDSVWTADKRPDGEKPAADKISSVLATLGGLRFSDTGDPGDPQAAAARQHERVFKLTAFDGRTTTIALGQKPAPKKPSIGPGQAPKAGEAAPAEPVYAFISSSNATASINSLMQRRSFQVDDYALTSLPQKPDELFEH